TSYDWLTITRTGYQASNILLKALGEFKYNSKPVVVEAQALTTVAPATPVANALYKDNIVKAWFFINMSLGSISSTDDFNVSSFVDNGVGNYRLNLAVGVSSGLPTGAVSLKDLASPVCNVNISSTASTQVDVGIFNGNGVERQDADCSGVIIGH
ncbi:MAG: hypothetical protein OEY29_16050, partial [Gammaproteobacteria bacterium]|nr:hypothetical protein [Gammaproteobacteria bacterium]